MQNCGYLAEILPPKRRVNVFIKFKSIQNYRLELLHFKNRVIYKISSRNDLHEQSIRKRRSDVAVCGDAFGHHPSVAVETALSCATRKAACSDETAFAAAFRSAGAPLQMIYGLRPMGRSFRSARRGTAASAGGRGAVRRHRGRTAARWSCPCDLRAAAPGRF